MGALKRQITAVSEDILQGEILANIPQPGALVSLYANCQTAADACQLFWNSNKLTNSFQPNLVTDADTGPDTSKDAVFENMAVPAGRLSLPVTVLTAQMGLHLVVKGIPGGGGMRRR